MGNTKTQSTANTLSALFARKTVQYLVLLALILLCYGHTLDVPFYLDDNNSLRGNEAIQQVDLGTLWGLYAARIVGYLTFALDYAVHGYSLTGYHLVNILIHVLATFMAYQVALALLKTPRLESMANEQAILWLPLITALIFAIHPLQIQAVTYIVQRLASLVALFYLSSLYCYLQFRLSKTPKKKIIFGFLLIISGCLALFTKQNAVTIPLVFLLLEWIFFNPQRKIIIAGAICTSIGLLGAYLLFPIVLNQELFAFISERTRETGLLSRIEYLSVQMYVLWSYILRFLLPVNLALIYEYAVPESFFSPGIFFPAVFHAGLILAAVLNRKAFPLAAFGILFYYTAHLVESSIIPIRDFAFDHRTYLPNFGLCLLVGSLVVAYLSRKPLTKAVLLLVCLVVLLLVALTWSRNQLWRDPIAFLQHEVEINNDSFTSYCFLGEAYYSAGQLTEAISIFERAQSYVDNLINRGNNTFESCYSNYAATLQEAGYLDEARQLISRMPVTAFTTQGQSKVAMTFGNVEALSGNFSEAEAHFNRARTLDPNNIYAVSNLAKLKILTGELQQSYELFIQVQKSDPGNMDAAIGLEYLVPLLRDNPQQ